VQATQQREQEQALEQHQRETLEALVGEQAIHTLGRPADLIKVQIRWLWEGCYRLNVFVGVDAASARVAHSYFLVTDGEGNILTSTPKLTRVY
jgi:hypothetical protein